MKAKKIALVSSVLSLLGAFALGLATNATKVSAAGETISETVTTDYGAFRLRGGDVTVGTITPDAANNALVYTGAWDSNFAVTDQFDTRAGNYSLKTHVYDEDWAIGDELGTGFCIYYNDNNYLNLYLKWNKNDSTACFIEGVMHNKVGGSYTNSYQIATLPNGGLATPGEFTDIWSDGANWTINGVGTNLRTNTTTLVNKGFDMTLHVERSTYSERTVDILQLQVDSYGSDGTTAVTMYSPKYAVDAFTNPSGKGASSLIDRKPQIGFNQHGMSEVTYSDIVFTNKNTETVNAKFTRVGTQPTTAIVNADSNTLTYNNTNYGTGFMVGDFATTSTGSVDVQATVSGTNGNASDTQIGFTYYLDSKNYAIIYARWDGNIGTIDGVHALFTVNGTPNSAKWAKDPWDNSYTEARGGNFIDVWTDFGGWITDSSEPMNKYNNFNNMRSESAITIASGFTFGLQRTRVTYASRLVDAFQFRVGAKGTDNVYHNWYSCTFCVDDYTYPNGGEEASELINAAPQIGFYAFNVGEITLSDIKYGGKKAVVSYSEKEQGRIDARKFVDDYMHFSDVSKDNGEEGTACKGNEGYYAQAKACWNALSNDARSAIATEDEFADARARLLAWASANGDTLDGTNILAAAPNSILNGGSSNGVDIAVATVSVSVLAAALCAAFLLIKKKKSSEK